MKDQIKVVELNKYESSIVINALNEFRNKLIDMQEDVKSIDEVLLKVIDAPKKKGIFSKNLIKNER